MLAPAHLLALFGCTACIWSLMVFWIAYTKSTMDLKFLTTDLQRIILHWGLG